VILLRSTSRLNGSGRFAGYSGSSRPLPTRSSRLSAAPAGLPAASQILKPAAGMDSANVELPYHESMCSVYARSFDYYDL